MIYYPLILTAIGKALVNLGAIPDDGEEKLDELAMCMERIPNKDKEMYLCIPLGLTENGKAVYMAFPHDFQGQVIGGIIWDAYNMDQKKDLQTLIDFMSGSVPYAQVNPLIGEVAKWSMFWSGKNPQNRWSGRQVVGMDAWDARDETKKYAYIDMLKDTWNTLGGTIVHRFSNNVEYNKSEIEKIVGFPVTSNFIRRFVRVSGWGYNEELREAGDLPTAPAAVNRIELKKALSNFLNG